MATQVASLLAILKLDNKDFKGGLKDAQKGLSGFTSRLGAAGENITRFGAKWTVATAPIAAGLGIALKKTHDFDRSMSNINAILNITGSEAETLRQKLLDFGGSTVAGPQAVADAFYEIVSGVADTTTHMAILEAAVATAEAGQADLTATTSAFISTMNSYKLGVEDAAFVSDLFTRTVGVGVLSMEELAAAFPQVTGLAAAMNIPLEELGASMAFLTAQGFSAGQSATFMKGMMTTLLNPTADLEEAIHALGFESGEAMLKQLGLVESYNALKEFGGGSLAGLITNQEALQGAIALTDEGFGTFKTNFIEGMDGATEAARGIQNETASWEIFTSKLDTLAITVGSTLMPLLTQLMDEVIIPLVEQITGWIQENPEAAKTLLMIAGAAVILGPALMALGGIISGVTAIAAALASPILAIGAAVLSVVGAVETANRVIVQPAGATKATIGQQVGSGQIAGYTWEKHYDATWKAIYDESIGTGQPHYAAVNQANLTANFLAGQTFNAEAANQAKALGGSVWGGQPYMVGERGPELFVPSGNGSIVPNGGGQNGGGDTYNIQTVTIRANSEMEGRAAAKGFKEEMRELKRRRG